MKNYKLILIAGIILLSFTSCNLEEKQIFDESSAARLEKYSSEAKEALISAEDGWVMDYFPIQTSRGYTFIVKFHANSLATFASISKITNSYRRDSCCFEIVNGNGPVLSFNTGSEYGDLHIFANPSSNEKEDIGDYEFVIIDYKTNKDQIKLKGSKRGTYIYLNKFDKDKYHDWENYFKDMNIFMNTVFNQNPAHIRLVSNHTTILASNGENRTFNFVEEGLDPIFNTEKIPFIIYPDGLRFQHPFTVDNKTVQSFKLSDDKHTMKCIDEGSTDVYFEGSSPIELLISDKDLKNSKNKWQFNFISPDNIDMNNKVDKLFSEIKDIMYYKTGGKVELKDMFIVFDPTNNDYTLAFYHKTITTPGKFYMKSTFEGDKIKLEYQNKYDANATNYVRDSENKILELVNLLSTNFIVSPNPECKLNLCKIKLTSESNNGISFILNL